ncbi:MAG: HNH endonuclease [Nitrososphaera sp.]|nr:HNH endonuclease [Nitrososphaera sp.]
MGYFNHGADIAMTELTAERLRELLDYNPETGEFVWRVSRGRTAAGAKAGTLKPDGYIYIGVDCRDYLAHRLAFLHTTSLWPREDVDHINMGRADNRWNNLREATRSENKANMRPPADNTSGFKGVSRHKRTGKWQAKIQSRGKYLFLGRFDTAEAAHEVYLAAAKHYFGEFARCA